MSKALNSPTGRLLRTSRLFSLPPPLPTPAVNVQNNSRILRVSDSATLPYPTHQAISAPPSSRSRGDWGLKRPLPSRVIPKTNPALRIKAIDNLEHITDFESAADHTQTLLKWQDLNMPMSVVGARNNMTDSRRNYVNAFHPNHDNTALQTGGSEHEFLSPERALQQRNLHADRSRWKTEGPYISGMTEDQFQRYLVNAVRKHKDEFRTFLGHVKVAKNREGVMADMREEAVPLDELDVEHRSMLQPNELDDWIKELRDDYTSTNSEMAHLIRDFFDLPPFPTAKDISGIERATSSSNTDQVPPATHPSAGLSYLLTDLIMDNHPAHGPQAAHDPVEGRILRTSKANGSMKARPDIGVAGFVASVDPALYSRQHNFKQTSSNQPQQRGGPITETDLDLVGGNKAWFQPQWARVDEQGRVRLRVAAADAVSIGVKTGTPVQQSDSRPQRSHRLDAPLDSSGISAGFGTGLPAENKYPRVTGFDVKQQQNKGSLAEFEAMAQIEALAKSQADRE